MHRGRKANRRNPKQISLENFTRNKRNFRLPEEEADWSSKRPTTAVHKILITGFSANANVEILRTFLVSQSTAKFLDFAHNEKAQRVIATVATKGEANTLQNISGLMFQNKKLVIRYLDPRAPLDASSSSSAGGAKPTQGPDRFKFLKDQQQRNDNKPRASRLEEKKAIELFIAKHYDDDSRMLNMSNLGAHLPDFSIDFNDSSFVRQVFDIMSLKCPDILTVLFNNNKIKTLAPFGLAPRYKLKLLNLSFANNEVSDFDELIPLKELNLRELVLQSNPVSSGLDEQQYQLEIVRRLPDLSYLDTRKIKSGADTHPITQLPPIRPNFCDTPDRAGFVETFLQQYFEAFDGDRNLLVDFYSEQSCFSLSLVPGESKHLGRGGSSFKRGEKFVPYLAIDRNLYTVTELDPRTKTLKTGPTHIVGTLLDLPSTKHDFESFTVDSFVSKLGTFEMLSIFIHGSFQESSKTQRSFSRVFLMVPAAPGAKRPAVIINDQLYLRYFTPKRVIKVAPQPPAAVAPEEIEMKKQMVLRFAEVTNLCLAPAEECLTINGWNYEKALGVFSELKAQNKIPPDAFVNK